MSTTVERLRVRPGTAGSHPLGLVPLTELPGVLSLITGRSKVILLPRKASREPVTACECGGMLVSIWDTSTRQDVWLHTDACMQCREEPLKTAVNCTGRHVGCSQPEPRMCQHAPCETPVLLSDRCAWDGAQASCCACCWDRPDIPSLDVVSHKRQ